ncbi:hypothetical protein, partial [Halorhodospira sp. 9622]|uniref:hypothetical protein n=1 Tax=Halorhodospira sp. 9622 TaxID=2899136 RepID=UPI001EE8A07C
IVWALDMEQVNDGYMAGALDGVGDLNVSDSFSAIADRYDGFADTDDDFSDLLVNNLQTLVVEDAWDTDDITAADGTDHFEQFDLIVLGGGTVGGDTGSAMDIADTGDLSDFRIEGSANLDFSGGDSSADVEVNVAAESQLTLVDGDNNSTASQTVHIESDGYGTVVNNFGDDSDDHTIELDDLDYAFSDDDTDGQSAALVDEVDFQGGVLFDTNNGDAGTDMSSGDFDFGTIGLDGELDEGDSFYVLAGDQTHDSDGGWYLYEVTFDGSDDSGTLNDDELTNPQLVAEIAETGANTQAEDMDFQLV